MFLLREDLDLKHKDKGKIKVSLALGRFQPLTIAHLDMFSKASNPLVVAIVRGAKKNRDRAPFDTSLITSIIQDCSKNIKNFKAIVTVPVGFIPTIIDTLRPKYEVTEVLAGTDRISEYQQQISRYKDTLDEYNIDIVFKEAKRESSGVSATKVRQALTNNDLETFKKLTPECEHKFYEQLRDQILRR